MLLVRDIMPVIKVWDQDVNDELVLQQHEIDKFTMDGSPHSEVLGSERWQDANMFAQLGIPSRQLPVRLPTGWIFRCIGAATRNLCSGVSVAFGISRCLIQTCSPDRTGPPQWLHSPSGMDGSGTPCSQALFVRSGTTCIPTPSCLGRRMCYESSPTGFGFTTVGTCRDVDVIPQKFVPSMQRLVS